MSVLIFIIVIAVLVFVHELGHFLIAKKSGIKVDEFAIGFPPRIWSFKKGDTVYAINAIPFGGYVKIFGEEITEETSDKNRPDSFVNKSKWIQVAVLSAGVVFNILLAWAIFSFSFMFNGFPITENIEKYNSEKVEVFPLKINTIQENSKAFSAGLPSGVEVVSLSNEKEKVSGVELDSDEAVRLINQADKKIVLEYVDSETKQNKTKEVELLAKNNNEPRAGIGFVGGGAIYDPNIFESVWYGAKYTYHSFVEISGAIFKLLGDAIVGKGSMDQVSGPIGIVNYVGDFAKDGIFTLLNFVAFFSINLAILNILPFPALDGGRIAMVVYEGVTRKQIKPTVANAINTIGFLILIGFMIFITIHDVLKFF